LQIAVGEGIRVSIGRGVEVVVGTGVEVDPDGVTVVAEASGVITTVSVGVMEVVCGDGVTRLTVPVRLQPVRKAANAIVIKLEANLVMTASFYRINCLTEHLPE
jgi:hypothetical protein